MPTTSAAWKRESKKSALLVSTTGIPPEKLVVTVAELGNIASATIPTQIARAVEAGELARGDQLMCVGLAGGLSLGVTLLTF